MLVVLAGSSYLRTFRMLNLADRRPKLAGQMYTVLCSVSVFDTMKYTLGNRYVIGNAL